MLSVSDTLSAIVSQLHDVLPVVGIRAMVRVFCRLTWGATLDHGGILSSHGKTDLVKLWYNKSALRHVRGLMRL